MNTTFSTTQTTKGTGKPVKCYKKYILNIKKKKDTDYSLDN